MKHILKSLVKIQIAFNIKWYL